MSNLRSNVLSVVTICAISGAVLALMVLPAGMHDGSDRRDMFRNVVLRPSEKAHEDQRAVISEALSNALAQKDFASAESCARQLIKLDPGSDFNYKGLGDVLFEEGKKDQARQAFSRVLHDPKSLIADSTLFMRYGELSAAAGEKSEARESFVKVLNRHKPEFLGKLAGQTADGMSLSELRSSALAVESDFYRGDTRSGEYQRRTLAAVAADPNSYIALMARAEAFYMAGHLADSRAEFDRAIKQAPAAVRDQIEPWIDVTYPFHSWDHVSSGVIQNGKVTITRKKVPLPNNLVDRGKYSTGGHIQRDRP